MNLLQEWDLNFYVIYKVLIATSFGISIPICILVLPGFPL